MGDTIFNILWDKVKEHAKKGYNEGTEKANSLLGICNEDIGLDYLKEDEKRLHINMRKRVNDYLIDNEEILIETVVSEKKTRFSLFITSERMLALTPLDIFQTGSKVGCSIFYYNELIDFGIAEDSKKYHTLSIKMKNGAGFRVHRIKIQPQISKQVFKILDSKKRSGC